MSGFWSNELELIFLEHFQAEPILWNAQSKDYKNRLKVYDAWMRISALMEIPVGELKHKKDSLLASYRGYKNKVKKSVKSGAGADDLYTPIWFAYELMDSFLGDTTKCKNTVNSVEMQSTSDNKYNGEEQPNSIATATNTTAAPTINRRQNPVELSEAVKLMKEALATFKSTIKRNESQSHSSQEDDDCDLYGKLLAKKLRKLPEEKKLKFMHDIDGMFLSSQYVVHSASSSPIPVVANR